jgi:hypothetical protein
MSNLPLPLMDHAECCAAVRPHYNTTQIALWLRSEISQVEMNCLANERPTRVSCSICNSIHYARASCTSSSRSASRSCKTGSSRCVPTLPVLPHPPSDETVRKADLIAVSFLRTLQPRHRHRRIVPIRERHSLLSASLCLSRACLGKMIVFTIKWRKKTRLFYLG